MPVVRWFRRLAWPLMMALLLSGCVTDGPRSTLHPAGRVAQSQMDIFMWTFWLSIGVLVLVIGLITFAVIRFRRKESDGDAIPNQVHGSVPLEITWTIIPVIIVILVAVPTVQTIFETENRVEPTEEDLVVNVVGYQWWWRFEYPDLGVVTANELHIPTDRRVILNLDSADVLHSFWAPKLAGKRDLIPNQDNQLWLSAEEPGVYPGHCAELCLGAHAYMRFQVIAEEPGEFESWVASFQDVQQAEANRPSERASQANPGALLQVQDSELIQQGQTLYAQKGCVGCHTAANDYPGMGNPNYPNLTNFGLRNTIAAAVLPNNLENLAFWIRQPHEVKPGNYMPDLFADDDPEAEDQSRAIAAYLLSLGTGGEGSQARADAPGGLD